MTVISSNTDAEDLSMTMVAEFDAALECVWNVWEDPRKLERWWGPPDYPATFTRYEFETGGECRYFMSGPEGAKHFGWWRIASIDALHRIEFANGLAGEDGEPDSGVAPMNGVAIFESIASGTRLTVLTQFIDTEQMEAMIGRGMEPGMRQAIGQIDALLAAVHAS